MYKMTIAAASVAYEYRREYSFHGWKYVVRLNSDYPEDGGFDDVLNSLDMWIYVVGRYDDADCYHAYVSDGMVTISNGDESRTKTAKVSSLIDSEEAFDTIYDLEDDVISSVLDLLDEYNDDVDPVVVHY